MKLDACSRRYARAERIFSIKDGTRYQHRRFRCKGAATLHASGLVMVLLRYYVSLLIMTSGGLPAADNSAAALELQRAFPPAALLVC